MTPRTKASATPEPGTWSAVVGFLPHKVTAYEEPARSNVLYLKWRAGGNWKKESLRRGLRTPKGTIDRDVERWAKAQAEAKYAQLVAGLTEEANAAIPAAPLTIRQGLERITDAEAGKYPTDTPHRREVEREMERAIARWGADTPWTAIKRADLRTLWRVRIQQLRGEGKTGKRGAEVTIQRVLAVAAWLRDEELIPAGACTATRTWRQELEADWLELTGERTTPTPHRPRHTLEEMRAILAASAQVDPRFELLMALGAELRLGQVRRARRPDLDRARGLLTIYGRRKKRGTVVALTLGQQRVLEHALTKGYLRDLEAACPDYPLFPAGQMPGGRKGEDPKATVARHAEAPPINTRTIGVWFQEAERLAKVQHLTGRGAYGLRRQAVDAAKSAGISREGLKAHGGWADTQVPDRIYAEQDAEYAREEARDVRAKIRGESDGE